MSIYDRAVLLEKHLSAAINMTHAAVGSKAASAAAATVFADARETLLKIYPDSPLRDVK